MIFEADYLKTQIISCQELLNYGYNIIMFQISFQDYSPAVFIRSITQSALEPYASPLKTLDRDELRPLLMELFKWKQFEFMDVVNILGFGRDKYVKITLDQLTDYILEKYLGETAIIRYTKHSGYARRDENIMNKKEFIETLALGLDFLTDFRMTQFAQDFQAIFDQLDKRKVGTIPHAEYCRFLKYYLGSESPMAVNPTKRVTQLSQSREMMLPGPQRQVQAQEQSPKRVVIRDSAQQDYKFSLASRQITSQQNLREYVDRQTALDQFHNLIINSITQKCREYDLDGDQKLFKNECQQFLYDVLQLEPNSINFIIANYFSFGNGNTVTFTEMIQIVCEVHFRQILTNIIKNERRIQLPSKILIDKQYFTDKIMENCYFFPIQPTLELLQRVFQQLLLKSDSSFSKNINLDDFRAYILTHCCHNKFIFRHQTKKSTHTLANPPASIIQAQNSHYEEDQSQGSSIIQSRRQFASTHKSISKPRLDDSKEHSIEGGQIEFSSNKRTKTNKFSQQSITIQNQLLPASFPHSNQQVNVSVLKGSNQQIKMANQSSHVISNQNIYLSKKREDKSFKEILWNQLEYLVSKYSSSQNGSINKKQCDELFNNQEIFKEDKSIFLNKTSKLFEKRPQVQLQLIVSYIIHLKGEQALIQFNSRQIKEISQILFNAYGPIMCLNKQAFQHFSQKLFAQNSKKLFQYKNYLQLVGRNLSLKNHF